MHSKGFPIQTILIVDDDAEDCQLVKHAIDKLCISHDLKFLKNGEDLMDYLYHRGQFSCIDVSPRPELIFLDLNMPKKSGLEALAEIKSDPNLRLIPIIVLTTSNDTSDIQASYHLGASSYICKPPSYLDLIEMFDVVTRYWLNIVKLAKSGG